MADIFISYARETRREVSPIAEALVLEGYDIWWDEELPVHRSYSDVILEQIGKAKAVLVVWSPAAVGSEWVRAEANMGREQKKLVQTLIGDATLPLPFNQIQFADLRGWRANRAHPEWLKVKASLTELVARPEAKAGAEAREVRDRFAASRPRSALIGWIALGAAAVLLIAAIVVYLRIGRAPAQPPPPAAAGAPSAQQVAVGAPAPPPVVATPTQAASQQTCRVADPTPTPLNVRVRPNGALAQTVDNNAMVRVAERANVNGKAWALIEPAAGGPPMGWVFSDYLYCGT